MNKIVASIAAVGLAATAALYNMSADDVTLFLQNETDAPLYTELKPVEIEFMKYCAEHGKVYKNKHMYEKRLEQFENSMEAIAEHNSQNGQTSTIGLNKFSDYFPHEFKQILGFKKGWKSEAPRKEEAFYADNLATEIDWRSKNAVTGVKDQG